MRTECPGMSKVMHPRRPNISIVLESHSQTAQQAKMLLCLRSTLVCDSYDSATVDEDCGPWAEEKTWGGVCGEGRGAGKGEPRPMPGTVKLPSLDRPVPSLVPRLVSFFRSGTPSRQLPLVPALCTGPNPPVEPSGPGIGRHSGLAVASALLGPGMETR